MTPTLASPRAPVIQQAAEPLPPVQDTKSDFTGYTDIQIDSARAVVSKTLELIKERGWAMWKCAALNNDRVIIVKDNRVRDYPSGYPVYTLDELDEIAGMAPGTLKLVHQVKVIGFQDALPGIFPEILPRQKN